MPKPTTPCSRGNRASLNLVVSGPGGAGKGTVIRRLVELDDHLWLSRSWTTRARRPGETEDAYTFVDKATFLARVESGGFLEWATVLGELYGTPIPSAPDGYDVVLEIDVQGARQVLERCENVVCVLLVPPSKQAQAERLRARGDPEEAILDAASRLGDREVEGGHGSSPGAIRVVNNDIDEAARELAAIIDAARQRRSPRQRPSPTR